MTSRLITVAWLLLVWLTLMESITVGAVLGGLAVAVGVTALFPERSRRASSWTIRPHRVVAMAVYFSVRFVEANLEVASKVIAPRPERLRRGIVGVPVVSTSRTLRATLANGVSLTPGTFIIDIDESTSTMYVHVLDVASPDQVRLAIHRLERMIAMAFGPSSTIAELDRRIAALSAAVDAGSIAAPSNDDAGSTDEGGG